MNRRFNPSLALVGVTLLLAAQSALAAEPSLLTLEECLRIALESNTKISIARQELLKARHGRHEAFGVALPDLDLSADYKQELRNPEVEFFGETFKLKPDEMYSMNARLNQYLYSGSVMPAYRAANHMLAKAGLNVAAQINNIIADVRIKFYEALYARELVKVNEESVKQLKSHLADSKKREKAGLNTPYDTLRFETRLAEAEPSLIQAKNNLAHAVVGLLDVMGLDPLSEVVLDGKLSYVPVARDLQDAIAKARENRPELKASTEWTLASEEAARAARSELYPSLKAFVNYNLANSPGLGDQTAWTDDFSVGIVMEFNLFDGAERSSRTKRKIVESNIARLQGESLARQVIIEVKTSFDELARADEFVQSQSKSVDYAQESYRIAKVSHDAGVLTQLELLDAQLALTRAKINFSKSLYEYSVARTRLEHAMGVIDESGK